ncbi:3-deoxy-7-phosphoheptulonate synthase [Spirillospora sp. NPDC048911]|uniref:3-deoxy-7-phosphoheptulonate synthase n=1 Tax=Spirillospora sp. NPDC048911 TaxID=3364527 RepID=UPI003719AA8B
MRKARNAKSRFIASRWLLPPKTLRSEIPLDDAARRTVERARAETAAILAGEDDRAVLVVGPCSVHDPAAALAYAEKLAELAREVADSLVVVMRVYVEKPRTRLGWKGLISDPGLDGSNDLNSGLRLSRGLMVQILQTGLPIGCEFLDPVIPAYIADTVSWGAIGARTVQSQIHRQLTSGLDMPVGIKNATTGRVEDAIDAIFASRHGHVFPGFDENGRAAVVTTVGNPDCHVVLRGGNSAPNYGPHEVARTLELLQTVGLPPRLVIDASHGNSGKDHERQAEVVAEVADRIAAGEPGIAGMMIESFLAPGRQDLVPGCTDQLTFGKSITDACVGWDQTVRMVRRLAEAIATRRRTPPQPVGAKALALGQE